MCDVIQVLSLGLEQAISCMILFGQLVDIFDFIQDT